MEKEDFRLFVWVLIAVTLLVTAFAFWYIYWAITYTPPEEIFINASLIKWKQ